MRINLLHAFGSLLSVEFALGSLVECSPAKEVEVIETMSGLIAKSLCIGPGTDSKNMRTNFAQFKTAINQYYECLGSDEVKHEFFDKAILRWEDGKYKDKVVMKNWLYIALAQMNVPRDYLLALDDKFASQHAQIYT